MTKRLSLLLLSFSLFIIANAEKEIKPSDAANHVSDSVTVTGGIIGGSYLSDSKGAPTLLNMGAAFPNQHLTIAHR